MRSIIIYDSITGNTKKIALAISFVLGAKLQRALDEKIDFDKYDLIVIGSGVYAGKPSKKIVKFLYSLPNLEKKKAVVFGTYAGQRTAIDFMKRRLEEHGAEVIWTWGCQASFMKFINWGRPDERDLASAKKFALGIKEKLVDKKQILA